jgi:hypothetical protein
MPEGSTLRELCASILRSVTAALLLTSVLFGRDRAMGKDLWDSRLWVAWLWDWNIATMAMVVLTFPFTEKGRPQLPEGGCPEQPPYKDPNPTRLCSKPAPEPAQSERAENPEKGANQRPEARPEDISSRHEAPGLS